MSLQRIVWPAVIQNASFGLCQFVLMYAEPPSSRIFSCINLLNSGNSGGCKIHDNKNHSGAIYKVNVSTELMQTTNKPQHLQCPRLRSLRELHSIHSLGYTPWVR